MTTPCTVIPKILSWLTDSYGEYSLYIQDHRYGAGYCAAIVPTELLEVIDNLTTGGDSYAPYVFSSYIDRCKADGLPVAYADSADAATIKLEAQLDDFSEAKAADCGLGTWHPAFELFNFLHGIKHLDHYEDYIRGWPVLKKGGARPQLALELLHTLVFPVGWRADGYTLYAPRVLQVNKGLVVMRAVVSCADVTVDSAEAAMDAAIRRVDEHLASTALCLLFPQAVVEAHGLRFISDAPWVHEKLSDLCAKCRWPTEEEVV